MGSEASPLDLTHPRPSGTPSLSQGREGAVEALASAANIRQGITLIVLGEKLLHLVSGGESGDDTLR